MGKVREKLNIFIRRRKIAWKTDLLMLGVFVVILLVFILWNPEIPDQGEIDGWTARFGAFAPLAIIGIIVVETVVAPIPGTIVPIVIGALYGVWPGILLAWTGNIIGSIIAFYIARKLGRPVVKKIIKEEKLKFYDEFLHRRTKLIWMAYLIPILPLDIISFVIGMSQIPFRKFLAIVSVGFILNLLMLTFFGNRLVTATGWERAVWAVVTMVFLMAALAVERYTEKNKQ